VVSRLDRPIEWVKYKNSNKKFGEFRESAGKVFFGLLNLFQQLKNAYGAIEKIRQRSAVNLRHLYGTGYKSASSEFGSLHYSRVLRAVTHPDFITPPNK
jgi:uncharacterized protein YfbU (UPF0304 family)